MRTRLGAFPEPLSLSAKFGAMTQALTQRQAAFCRALAESNNVEAAYRAAYNTGKMAATVVARRADRLMSNPAVVAHLIERTAHSARRLSTQPPGDTAGASADTGPLMTARQHIDELQRLRDLAIANKQISAAITAEINRAKIAGLHDEKVDSTNLEIEKLSDDALVARIKHLIVQTGIAVLPDDLAGASAQPADDGVPAVSEATEIP